MGTVTKVRTARKQRLNIYGYGHKSFSFPCAYPGLGGLYARQGVSLKIVTEVFYHVHPSNTTPYNFVSQGGADTPQCRRHPSGTRLGPCLLSDPDVQMQMAASIGEGCEVNIG